MIYRISLICFFVFLISHLWWQINLLREERRCNVERKKLYSTKEIVEFLKREGKLDESFFQRIKLLRIVSKIGMTGFLAIFLLELMNMV